ncbi:pectinesterase-like [Macadamia integrifolia]|uniref:pectinesterase-like n=1 Tax=Macadamia integrifolia TaxID=60698 RepID=UPI001C4F66FB|nr:pectinesterase-like [Macadamia integrifolia]
MSRIKEILVGFSELGMRSISLGRRKKKQLLLLLVASSLLVAAVIGVVAGIASHKNKNLKTKSDSSPAHAVLKSSCSITLYPELCYSAVATVPGATDNISTHKDVVEVSLNITTEAVQHNYFTIEKLIDSRSKNKSLTEQEMTALHDCLDMVDETLDELHKTADDLKAYTSDKNTKKKSISEYADDLKTLVSGAMTNQESCLDGFSHDNADKEVRSVLEAGQIHVFQMCSNALAMIKNLTDTDMAEQEQQQGYKLKSAGRHLIGKKKEDDDARDEVKESRRIRFPEWLSAGDRRLLQATEVTPDVTVAADGSGNYSTVSEAVAAAPEKSSKRYIIRIKAGVYRENVEVKKKKINLVFLGDGRKSTIITGRRNVVDGSTTFHSATVAAVGQRFLARDITFENTAGPSKHQAVALRVGSDMSAFHRCDILAYQDTLYVHSLRQFYVDCLIIGTVDFIFGNAAAVFQNCDIHARLPDSGQKNMVTAQGRADPNQNTGIVIQKCRIGATTDLESVNTSFLTYLGRPWKQYSRTIIMQSNITDVIDPVGWHVWNGDFALETLFYGEYENRGAGAGTSNRVDWKGYKNITDAAEVQPFTVSSFIAGDSWLPSTGFPFSLGL